MMVHLGRDEIWWIFGRAQERNGPKVRRGVPNYRIHPTKSDLQTHYEGCRAEYAVAKVLNGSADWTCSLHGDDGMPDIDLPDGTTVQVKYRRKRGWDFALLGDDYEEFTSDIGILVWPANGDDVRSTSHQSVDIVGYITREQFEKRAIIKNYGYGARLVVEANQLEPIEALVR